ncbi:MAG: hypothetical protein ABEH81_03810 [Halopenitus sp.]
MKEFPPFPEVSNAPNELFADGHLWVQELVDGVPFRFRVLDSGLVQFGDADDVFEPGTVPLRLRRAARHVREQLDREALRDAGASVESVVFFGVAVEPRRVDYDWPTAPAFAGTDVWQADEEQFLSVDAVDRVYERLGLASVPTVAKEVHARDLDPESYAVPTSSWADEPAAGVVFRDKTGHRAMLRNPDLESADESASEALSPPELVAERITDAWLDELVAVHDVALDRVEFDEFVRLATERLVTEHGHELREDVELVDEEALRSAVVERVEPYLRENRA